MEIPEATAFGVPQIANEDMKAIVAYTSAFIVLALFIRLLLIRIRVICYIKKHHHAYWENNILLFFSGSRASISQLTRGLDDPKIEDFKKAFANALKQFLLVIVLIFSLLLVLAVLKLI